MTLTITRVAASGDGMAEGEGPFPRTLPGEVITLAQDGTPRIVTPSPDRVAAPCKHFKSCGGCAMQHASDAFVADWKTQVIRTGLTARGIEAEIRPIVTSPARSRRRATLHGKRTKSGAQVGFHTRASATLIEVPECPRYHRRDPCIAGADGLGGLAQGADRSGHQPVRQRHRPGHARLRGDDAASRLRGCGPC